MKKSGFTLAEVLITLSIIGVVSALTIPNLGASTSVSKNKATLQNTIATLNGALTQNQAQYGWNLSDVTQDCSSADDNAKSKYSKCALFNTQLIGETYLGPTQTSVATTAGQYGFKNTSADFMREAMGASASGAGSVVAYRLANGAVFGFGASGAFCPNESRKEGCVGFIDVNGNAGPNQPITCVSASLMTYLEAGAKVGASSCTIKENTNADIFPIYFHGNYVVPGTNAVIQYLSE